MNLYEICSNSPEIFFEKNYSVSSEKTLSAFRTAWNRLKNYWAVSKNNLARTLVRNIINFGQKSRIFFAKRFVKYSLRNRLAHFALRRFAEVLKMRCENVARKPNNLARNEVSFEYMAYWDARIKIWRENSQWLPRKYSTNLKILLNRRALARHSPLT